MYEFVSATRLSEKDFWAKSALGGSLQRISGLKGWESHIAFSNASGLPEIYNEAIQSERKNDILIFVHDDVWIDDYFVLERISEGLQNFDLVGVAGNKRRVPFQPAWAFVDNSFTWDDSVNLSGSVAHGKFPFGDIGYFGMTPSPCELLDGVFLAARKSVLKNNNVYFDNRFDFHFYDMDFCRSARERNLKLGTWPIAITHQSGGAFGTPTWVEKYKLYLEKWKQ
jgi:hypothetical protein